MTWDHLLIQALSETLKVAPTTAVLVAAIFVAMQRAGRVATGTTTAVRVTTQELGLQLDGLSGTIADLRAAVTVLNASLVELRVGHARLEERAGNLGERVDVVEQRVGSMERRLDRVASEVNNGSD